MGSLGIKRIGGKADPVQVFQVAYRGSSGHAALLDAYVDMNDLALTIKVGRPGCGLAGAIDTSGRAKVKVDILGDATGAETLPEDATLITRVSQDSVAQYVGPRLLRFIALIHGQALTS